MRKLCAVLAGLCLFALVLAGFKFHMDTRILENKDGFRNLRTYERFWSSEAQKLLIEENTLPVFGSSELTSLSYYEKGVGSFLNGKQMNIISIGAGNFQSLHHAITLGAISEGISSKKVALFLSPQWFDKDGCDAAAFAARMSENELLEFLANKNISKETKRYVLERTEKLLSNSPTQLARIRKYKKAVEQPISAETIYKSVLTAYWNYRAEYEVYQQLERISNDIPYYDLDAIDFDAVLALAEQQGEESCTNNDFGIYDSYWDTYVKDTFNKGEVATKEQIYTQSPEYGDLECFLNVAEELGIEVILVSIPVHGKWYEYRGQLCDVYYQKVGQIAAQYDNVKFVDMSVYEDEQYFLKDIMHLGWKGWTRINEVLYKEFTNK